MKYKHSMPIVHNMEKLIVVIDNRNSMKLTIERPATNPEKAAKELNSILRSLHHQDTIVSIETH